MKYQMIISDYDGTLIDAGENYINQEVVDAIKRFINLGGKFIICSGRPIGSIKQILNKVGLGGVAVGLQGAVIYDLDKGKEICVKGLAPTLAVEIIKSFKREKGELVVYVGDDMYFDKDGDFVKLYQQKLNVKGYLVEDLVEFVLKQNKPVCKIGLLTDEISVLNTVKKYNEIYGGKGAIFNSGYKYMAEVVSPDFAKGDAVKFLAEYFGVPFSKIMAVGDSTNDISLLNGKWHGVCVGDGHEKLKGIAKEITVPIKEKPIKYLIEKYL